MLWLRKIVFYVFALLYLILCPLIVSRMLGFVFDPAQQRFEKTGLVYISTNPPDATVYIDGKLAHQKTPTAIHDLAPGDHFIRIELNGYNDWENTIPIIAKKATVLANTLLIPEQWPINRISTQTYKNIYIVDDDIILAVNPLLEDIDLFHTTQKLKVSLFSKDSIYAQGQLVHLYKTPGSPYILLQVTLKDTLKFLWIKTDENPPLIEDISDFFPKTPSNVVWNNGDNQNIYAVYPENVFRIDIKNKAMFLSTLPDHLKSPIDNLRNRFLINDGNDLIVREGTIIRLFPTKQAFSLVEIYDLARSQPQTNMYFEERNGALFYLDESGFLSVVQILPYHPMLNIPIPDAIRIDIQKKTIL